MKKTDSFSSNAIFFVIGLIGGFILVILLILLNFALGFGYFNKYDTAVLFLCSHLIHFGIFLYIFFTKYRWIGIGALSLLAAICIYEIFCMVNRWEYYVNRVFNPLLNHYL